MTHIKIKITPMLSKGLQLYSRRPPNSSAFNKLQKRASKSLVSIFRMSNTGTNRVQRNKKSTLFFYNLEEQ